MPPTSSQTTPFSPTPLLALICAAIVKTFDSSWLARPLAELAAESGVRPERVSRLWRRLLGAMERLLARASTRGRKSRRRPSKTERRRIRAEALLSVAGEVIRLGGVKKRRARDFLIAARDRLKAEQDISHRDFCRALRLSERTVRSWARKSVAAPEEPDPTPRPQAKRWRGVGRFDLAVTLPELQVVGDTTNLTILGVPLKVVAFQDPGRRHLSPWESFLVESEENHELVMEAIKEAVGDRTGMQVVVDQGSPYMAAAVKDACEDLELLHEPQKEGTPTEKATKERQFGVVKHFLGPLLTLTGKIAEAVPSLQNADLAKAFGRLLLGTYLRVYVAAAAVRETNRPDDPVVLEEIARVQREKAVAEHRSAKLLLEGIFERYHLEGSKRDFVRAHRRRQLEDIEEAERRLVKKAGDGSIRNWSRYFSGILVKVVEERAEARRQKAGRRRREAKERAQRQQDSRTAVAWEQLLREHPEHGLAEGLKNITSQYRPNRNDLLYQGAGLGTRQVRQALQIMVEQSGQAMADRAEVGWRTFLASNAEPRAVPLVRAVFDALLTAAGRKINSPQDPTSAILNPGSDHQQDRRPEPGRDLRFSAARSGST
jgi:hypothetical protein